MVPPAPDDWVPDVRKLRRFAIAGADAQGRPFPPKLPPALCRPMPRKGGAEAFREAQIKVDLPGDAGPSIMCITYTIEESRFTHLRAIRETWASSCDGWLAFSTISDPRVPAISIPHAGNEEYRNMWQKVRAIWRFVARHYLDEFSFFMIGGDDLFLMPQNLRGYLSLIDADPSRHLFLGRRLRPPVGVLFNSGGSGYVLSQRTLRTLDEHLDDPRCNPARRTSEEDVQVAMCLRKVADLHPLDTRDELGRERFHPLTPEHTYQPPRRKPNATSWWVRYNSEWGLKSGKDCCAPDSVSFHYVRPPAYMRHLYALLYTCDGRAKE